MLQRQQQQVMGVARIDIVLQCTKMMSVPQSSRRFE
jgi:hypothetical protein